MKNILLIILIFSSFYTTKAQLNMPEPSPEAKIQQLVGFTKVSIAYSRPAARGRKVFGALVPFDKLWRTGASDATTIRFSDPVTIEENLVPAGNYSLFSIPGPEEWIIILNKDTVLHGSSGYNEANDQVRFKVKPETAARFHENFTIEVSDIANYNAYIYLIWENTQVKIKLKTNADEQIMAEINERINVKKEDKAGLYIQSARYYHDNGKDLNQALVWAKKAVEKDPDMFYLQLLAKIQAGLGDYKSAISSAKKSSEMAEKKKASDVINANEKLIAEWKKR